MSVLDLLTGKKPRTNSGPVANFKKQCPLCHHDGFSHRDLRWDGPILLVACDWLNCACSREYVAVDE